MNRMIKQINQLQFSTDSSLRTVQQAMVPAPFDLGAERRHTYSYSGYTYPIRVHNRLVFYCKNIPFRSLGKRKNNLIFIDTMINLIKRREIYPFLVFINNKFVKWSNISIVHDLRYSYLIIDNIDTENFESIHSIYLPFSVAYNEKGIRYGLDKDIFVFDDEGKLDQFGNTVISYSAKNFLYKTDGIAGGIKNIEINDLDPVYKMSDFNVLAFRDGLFRPDADIRMEAFNMFTVDEGEYIEGSVDTYKVFYYKRTEKSVDNIYRFENVDILKDIIRKRNSGITPPKWFELLETPFDFSFTKDKEYQMNVEEGISYIMNYNPLLMTDMFKGLGDIETRSFTGLEFIKLAVDGSVKLPRTLDGRMFDNYVMVFVDGLLYKHYDAVKHKGKYVTIPITDIESDSIVEILYFKNIDNRRYTINLSKSDTIPDITDPTLNLDKIQLFYKVPFDPYYELEVKDEIQYLVPFTILNRNKFRLSLSYYYEKDLVMACDNQFRYRSFNIKEESLYIDLPEDFWYCKNEKAFMCFINQTRLNGDEFRITIPKNTRPFDDIRLYTTVPMEPGDKVELFYIGTEVEDILLLPKMPINGDIVIDKSKLAYGLSKDIYLVFVNGYKIPPEHIIDVDSNHIKITHNYDTVKNVSVVKYINDEEILTSYLQAGNAIWDQIIEAIPEVLRNKLLNATTQMTDKYERFDGREMYTLKAILLEIIREYWQVRRYSDGTPFVYDYDTSVFEEKGGVYVLDAMDANNEERIITDKK